MKRTAASLMAKMRADMKYAFAPAPSVVLPIANTDVWFPVHRIYCVARNYSDHVKEMGGNPDADPPCFFTKPSDAVVLCWDSATRIPYPMATNDLHYEVELVVGVGKDGAKIPVDDAMEYAFGYGVAIDLTRRDLQTMAKAQGRPWDSAKAFDRSAPVSAIHPVSAASPLLDAKASIWLDVNGQRKQDGLLGQMIWSVPKIISFLSHEFELRAGDLIMTGTPAGVGPIGPGDRIRAGIDGIDELAFEIV